MISFLIGFLAFLNASRDEYTVIFTANASAALKLVGEAFLFEPNSRLVLTADNHNSVNGLRVPARRLGAAVDHVPLDANLRACDPLPWLPRRTAPSLQRARR